MNTERQLRIEKFDEWMLKIRNIYYFDNEKMLNAYDKIN
jgi:hypothetical protein